MQDGIQHIWFDLEGTLTIRTPEFNTAHDRLRYQTYAVATNQPLDQRVQSEFEDLYSRYGSNSAVFRSLGLPSDYWQQQFNTLDETQYFTPDIRVYKTLDTLRHVVPISMFTNVTAARNLRTLTTIGVDPTWFTHLLTGDDITERKPALDGFHKLIELSGLRPEQLLYVGDRVDVDVVPAKALGIKTAVVWGASDTADYSFSSFEALLSLVENIGDA
jgi:FMN phosphatase YigB (HAD superfamily)